MIIIEIDSVEGEISECPDAYMDGDVAINSFGSGQYTVLIQLPWGVTISDFKVACDLEYKSSGRGPGAARKAFAFYKAVVKRLKGRA